MLQSIKYTIIFTIALLYTNDAAHFVSAAIFCRLFMFFASLFRDSAGDGCWFVGMDEFIYPYPYLYYTCCYTYLYNMMMYVIMV